MSGGEPVRGLPERLPAGERLLWQGVPSGRPLARRALHLRTAALYFGALLVWGAVSAVSGGASAAEAARSSLLPGGLALGVLGGTALLAWLTARTTVYTITSQRVAIRFGIALPVTVNVPFTAIAAAGLRAYEDGTGDIPLTLAVPLRLAWPVLWPHVRPWRVARPEPMLRAVPEAARVAQILGRALAAASAQPTSATALPSSGAEALGHGAVAA